jgi:mono/diheme cytochrome c family protein
MWTNKQVIHTVLLLMPSMGMVNRNCLVIREGYHQHDEGHVRRRGNDMTIHMFAGAVIISLVASMIGTHSSIAMPKEPASTTVDLAKGKTVFVRHCAGCHGQAGRGDGYRLLGPEPANLTRPATKKKSDAALLATIHEGKPNMPSWKVRLSKEESRAVLAYIRTLTK